MNEHVVYSADEVARIFIFIFWFFKWMQSVKKSNLVQYNWFFCLKQRFADPTENCVRFQKPLWASRDYRANYRHRSITHLLILTQRTNPAFFIALRVFLKRANFTNDGVRFAFDFRASVSLARRQRFKPSAIPFTN